MSLLDRCKRAVSFWQIVAQMLTIKIKERSRWAWRHRTKTAGALTMGLGGAKTWAMSHPTLHLPGEGYLLLGCGAVITAIGGYNTLANIFGWEDDP